MPTYDYACRRCGWEGEGYRTVEERKNFLCPECGNQAEIVFRSAPAVHFHGGGFPSYTTKRLKNLEEEKARINRRFEEERMERRKRWLKDPPFRVLEGKAMEERLERDREYQRKNQIGPAQGLKVQG